MAPLETPLLPDIPDDTPDAEDTARSLPREEWKGAPSRIPIPDDWLSSVWSKNVEPTNVHCRWVDQSDPQGGPEFWREGSLTEFDLAWFNDVYEHVRFNKDGKLPPKTFIRKLHAPEYDNLHMIIIEAVDKTGLATPDLQDPASRLESAPFIYFMMRESHPLLDLHPPPVNRIPLPKTSGLLPAGPASRFDYLEIAEVAKAFWMTRAVPDGLVIVELDRSLKPILPLSDIDRHVVVQSDVDWLEDLVASGLFTGAAGLPKTRHFDIELGNPEDKKRTLVFLEHINTRLMLPDVELDVPASRFARAPYVCVITPDSVDETPLPAQSPAQQTKQKSPSICKEVTAPRKTITAVSARASTTRLQAVVGESNLLWPNTEQAIIFRFLDQDSPSAEREIRRQKVRTAIKEWEKYAAVKFKEQSHELKADIKIAFKDDGSWSNVGTDCIRKGQDESSMNFGWIDGRHSQLSVKERAVILHEFGHALGMLHEHQSPAFGGTAIRDTEAAVAYYAEHQQWSETMVRQQIIETYNLKSVTNFSAVDESSIMMYPLPDKVTGLGHDIPFNSDLSDMDKAYVMINYPRTLKAEEQHTAAPGWTLERALKVVGMLKADKEGAMKILAAQEEDARDGYVDPSNIRAIFSAWTLRAHGAKAAEHESRSGGNKAAAVETAHALPSATPATPATRATPIAPKVIEVSVDKCPCETSRMRKRHSIKVIADKIGVLPKRKQDVVSHAVIDEPWLTRKEAIPVQNGEPANSVVTARWTCVRDPRSHNRIPKDFEKQMITTALLKWTIAASIDFCYVDDPQQANIVFVFQDFDPVEKVPFKREDTMSSCRSYTRPARSESSEDTIKEHREILKLIQAEIEQDSHKLSEEELEDVLSYARESLVPHNIALRGMCSEADTTNDVGEAERFTPWERSIRTIVHEVGHFLGLDHEYTGLSALIHDRKSGLDEQTARKAHTALIASQLDMASVMDCLRSDGPDSPQSGYRTVCEPSQLDLANIALLYPGANLVKPNAGTESKFTLLPCPDGDEESQLYPMANVRKPRTLMEHYGLSLGYDIEQIYGLVVHACNGDWAKLRNLHLAYLKEQQAASFPSAFPSHAARALEPAPALALPAEHASGQDQASTTGQFPNLKRVLWNKLNDLFGPSDGASAFLSLQFPTRFLAKDEFAFQNAGIYSNFAKPVTVNEAEFRLTDQLYDAAKIVSGPNGRSLSTVYEMALNNLVPKYDSSQDVVRQAQQKMRSWLLSDTSEKNAYYKNDARVYHGTDVVVPGPVAENWIIKDGSRVGARMMSRMEVGEALLLDYLHTAETWRHTKTDLLTKAMQAPEALRLESMEAATRRIVNEGAIQNAIIASKWSDAVVRGDYHGIRDCVAHLDIKSMGESLQDAKDSLRESTLGSLYGASRVLPVLMQPFDWASALDTSFNPLDLNSDPAIIEINRRAKLQQLDSSATN